ncbi:MAG TPA: 4-(cytidine 5'-diphospho)-2-C-methyl-D-erythritol kinase [Desulfobulbaceae bacterium]|nr:4-(cytidine 5'-diphospho)-2-C-methyl-D-erythritol kinase [Desulfobulbaceae bacterium]
MHARICLRAPAKINLYLRVIGRRPDGYHLLASLMQKLALFDRVEIERVPGLMTLDCPDSNLPHNQDNIALRAAHLFGDTFVERLPEDYGARIVLRKKIPIAAGLGGGSSDAAAVLVGLDKIFQTGCSKQELANLGVQLGADVPLFIYDWPVAWATGIGETLIEADGLNDASVLLVNPGFLVSTKWVYENLPLTLEGKIFNLTNSNSNNAWRIENPFIGRSFSKSDLYNDLEQVTQNFFKEICMIKEQLTTGGASGALMSGSGPTVFAVFDRAHLKQANACYLRMRDMYRQTFLVKPLQKEQSRFEQ